MTGTLKRHSVQENSHDTQKERTGKADYIRPLRTYKHEKTWNVVQVQKTYCMEELGSYTKKELDKNNEKEHEELTSTRNRKSIEQA